MPSLDEFWSGCVASHERLLTWLCSFDEVDVTQPSLLPNWTVGHVLTHIARNADGCRNMSYGAPMYPGGLAQRNGDIDGQASRPFALQVADIELTLKALERTWTSLNEEQWAANATAPFGVVQVTDVPMRRWREVEVHRMDLGLGSTWRDLPDEWVRADLPTRRHDYAKPLPSDVTALGERAELSWLFSRPVGQTITPPPAWF